MSTSLNKHQTEMNMRRERVWWRTGGVPQAYVNELCVKELRRKELFAKELFVKEVYVKEFEGMAKERISNPGDPKKCLKNCTNRGTVFRPFGFRKGRTEGKGFLFMMPLI